MTSSTFVDALRQFRWQVRVFHSSGGVLENLQTHAADALVLRGACAGAPGLIATLRKAAPGAAVVWQAQESTALERVAALDAGVDVCTPGGMEVLEWDALLRNLYRRTLRHAMTWRLDRRARALAGPGGEQLPLTPTESAFFIRLLNAPGQCLHRERFFPAGARSPLDAARRVDVLVSRLRSKARRMQIELPVLAVRGWGYLLLPHTDADEPD
ncbi:winged helix-turn-helix domain-containing protein [Achromobacter seleniivolatilans]|uniref:Winged helix-turn-helix domain-containing protein n=1 Tax=Achromobacter seleniivolatilans TaxID=3047478 RepID=A0ABY9M191_9BURK|nr:winged helix-turn-helix domain-containing protein [Achromobacter sp. R39]WMD19637.1 winged helix-turn-helix domain-containing protein [Achromobacter sp. R39]